MKQPSDHFIASNRLDPSGAGTRWRPCCGGSLTAGLAAGEWWQNIDDIAIDHSGGGAAHCGFLQQIRAPQQYARQAVTVAGNAQRQCVADGGAKG